MDDIIGRIILEEMHEKAVGDSSFGWLPGPGPGIPFLSVKVGRGGFAELAAPNGRLRMRWWHRVRRGPSARVGVLALLFQFFPAPQIHVCWIDHYSVSAAGLLRSLRDSGGIFFAVVEEGVPGLRLLPHLGIGSAFFAEALAWAEEFEPWSAADSDESAAWICTLGLGFEDMWVEAGLSPLPCRTAP